MITSTQLSREEALSYVLEGADNVMCSDMDVIVLGSDCSDEDGEETVRWAGVTLDDVCDETGTFPQNWVNFELWY